MAKKKGAEGKRTGRSAAQRTATSTAGGLCSTAQDFDHAGKEAAMFLVIVDLVSSLCSRWSPPIYFLDERSSAHLSFPKLASVCPCMALEVLWWDCIR